MSEPAGSRPTLGVIIASVRPVRVGAKVGVWIVEQARQHGAFEVDVIDLKEVALPFLDETTHPVQQKYEHDHTKRWSERISRCQAFVFVTPEYNHGYPASLKNAIDTVNKEWWYKPVGFASYGGVSGGLRSVTQLKPVTSLLRMPAAADAFVAPFVAQQIKDDVFEPNDVQVEGTKSMLDELAKLTEAMIPLQEPPTSF